jgi:hypothetical protein
VIDEIVDISYKNILSFLCTEIIPLAFVLLISLGCTTSFYDFQRSGNTVSFSFCTRFQNSFILVTPRSFVCNTLVLDATPVPVYSTLNPQTYYRNQFLKVS